MPKDPQAFFQSHAQDSDAVFFVLPQDEVPFITSCMPRTLVHFFQSHAHDSDAFFSESLPGLGCSFFRPAPGRGAFYNVLHAKDADAFFRVVPRTSFTPMEDVDPLQRCSQQPPY